MSPTSEPSRPSAAPRTRAPGRDQMTAIERLVRVVAVLSTAGDAGAGIDHLVRVGGYGAETQEDRRTQLSRDIRHLGLLGWQIQNVGERGEPAWYRLRTVDNRLTVRLSPTQRAALHRAALVVDRADLVAALGPEVKVSDAPSAVQLYAGRNVPNLDVVIAAVRRRARLRFRYNGKDRLVHGDDLRPNGSRWYLTGREDEHSSSKHFVVQRMDDVTSDAPGTAQPAPESPRPTLDPLSWEVDPPMVVTTRCQRQHLPDVERLLGKPLGISPLVPDDAADGGSTDPDGTVQLEHRVSSHAAFRARLYELGVRVRLVGPPEMAESVRAELEALVHS